jgi:hypothetical protein
MIKHKVSKRGIRTLFKDVIIGKLVHSMWRKACIYDGVNPASSIVVFSDDNPYAKAHDRAVRLWFRMGYGRVKLP